MNNYSRRGCALTRKKFAGFTLQKIVIDNEVSGCPLLPSVEVARDEILRNSAWGSDGRAKSDID